MEWYWYITGLITSIVLISVIINLALISGYAKVTLSKPVKEKIHIVYDWQDDSGPISRAS
jgi:hypothetical protein